MISEKEALEIVEVWLNTPFEGGRHLRRIKQIDQIESLTHMKVPTRKKVALTNPL
jgi:ribose 5-phosphate isomerase B